MNRASASGNAESAIEATRIREFDVVVSVAILPATNPTAACEKTVGICFDLPEQEPPGDRDRVIEPRAILLLTNYFLGDAASFFLSLAVSSASVERDSARCHAVRAWSGFPHAA